MIGLMLVVVSVGLLDSINPSTGVPALWLASARSTVALSFYTLAVFITYLAGGLVLLLGPGRMLISSLHHIGGPLEHGLQATGGILALSFAIVVWRSRNEASRPPKLRRIHGRASAFALGAGIMLVELPTAFMYFGAISAILAAHPGVPAEIALLTVYNLMFVAPLLALVSIRRGAPEWTDSWIEAAQRQVRRAGQVVLSGLAGAAGTALVAIGFAGLLTS